MITIAGAVMVLAWSVIAPVVGGMAPGFTGLTTDGKAISLDDYTGKTVILEWTNHDCPFVDKHYSSGNMQSAQRRATAAGQVVWITIISSAPGEQGHVTAEMANYLTQSMNAAPTAVVLDETGAIGRAFGAKTTPHMFVIDADGLLRYSGAIDSIPAADVSDISRADNYVLDALSALSDGRSVITQQSRPYGCSVKYGS